MYSQRWVARRLYLLNLLHEPAWQDEKGSMSAACTDGRTCAQGRHFVLPSHCKQVCALTHCTPTPGRTTAAAPAAHDWRHVVEETRRWTQHKDWLLHTRSTNRGSCPRSPPNVCTTLLPNQDCCSAFMHAAQPPLPTSSSFSSYEAGMPCSLVIQPRTAFFPDMSGGSEVTCGVEVEVEAAGGACAVVCVTPLMNEHNDQ